MLCRSWFVLLYFFFWPLCVFCSSSIYGFWFPLWYIQTLLKCYITTYSILYLNKKSQTFYYSLGFVFSLYLTADRWDNGTRVRLECGRSWVRAPVDSNQTIKLVFDASLLSTQHYGQRTKTSWLWGITIMCPSGAISLPVKLLFQWVSIIKIKIRVSICNLFPPWYTATGTWKIAHLALSNHSLTSDLITKSRPFLASLLGGGG